MATGVLATRNIVRIVLTVVAVVAVLYFLYLVRAVIGLMLVSVFLAVALAPAVDFLNQGRVPRWTAILVVYLSIILGIFGLGLLVVPPVVRGVNDLVDNLPTYVEDLNHNETFKRYDDKYHITEKLKKEADKAPNKVDDAAGTLADVTVGVFTRLVQFLTVLVLTFILLLDGRRFIEFVFRELPPDREARARKVASDMHRAVAGYVLGNLAISIVAGLITYATLELLGVPFALPLALLMAFFDLIPLVGATLGGAIIAIVCAIVDFPTAPIVWIIVLIVYQQTENHLVQPVIYGRTVKLHPLLVIVSILIGATLLGVLGALLAIPAGAAVADPDQGLVGAPRRWLRGDAGRRGLGSRARLFVVRRRDAADAEQPGTDVRADHRTDLGYEQRRSAHDLLRFVDKLLRLVGRLNVLHDPGVGAVGLALLGIVHQPRQRAAAGAHPLDRRDLLLERQDRLDLERRPEPG